MTDLHATLSSPIFLRPDFFTRSKARALHRDLLTKSRKFAMCGALIRRLQLSCFRARAAAEALLLDPSNHV